MNFSKTFAAASAFAFLASCGAETTKPTETQATTTTTKTTQNPEITAETMQKSGVSYNEVVDYVSPGGNDAVRFEMTTDGAGTITAIKATIEEGNDMSKNFTKEFNQDSLKIIGKKLSEISDISAVGGASLTTAAFVKFASSKQ